MITKTDWIIYAFILAQIAIIFIFGYTPYDDSDAYIAIAKECVGSGEPYPIMGILYKMPFLWNIGAINAAVASLALTGSVVPLMVGYALLKGLTAALFYSLSKKLLGQKTAILCLLLYVLYPANYGESTTILSELPFMFFIMLGMWLAIVHNRFFLAGLFFAFANWFRPLGIVFLLTLIIYIVYNRRDIFLHLSACTRKDMFLRLFAPISLLLGYVLMVCVIGFASMQRTGLFMYQAKTGWMNLACYCTNNSEECMAVRDNENWNVAQKDSAWHSMFMGWLKEHPGEYVSHMPLKVAETYVSDNVNLCAFAPDKRYEGVSLRTLIRQFPALSPVQWLTVVNLLFYYFLLLTALYSLRRFSMKSHLLPVSCIIIGTLMLMLIGFKGDARFHQPFMPFFIMLSALALRRP